MAGKRENEHDYSTDEEQILKDSAKTIEQVYQAIDFCIQDDPTLLLRNLVYHQSKWDLSSIAEWASDYLAHKLRFSVLSEVKKWPGALTDLPG